MADVSVRPARPDDAPAIATAQAAAWRPAYASVLPEDTFAALEGEAGTRQWQAAVTSPPSPRHRVLVACSGADIVGVAAFGPSEDNDLDAAADADLSELLVDPGHRGQGHGSRLLAATVDHLRGDGFARAHLWVSAQDEALQQFLTSTGWGVEVGTRTLDLRGDGAVVVDQVRMHTDIRESEGADSVKDPGHP